MKSPQCQKQWDVRQLKGLSEEGTTNHPAKALTLVDHITTRLIMGGEIRMVVNVFMLLFAA